MGFYQTMNQSDFFFLRSFIKNPQRPHNKRHWQPHPSAFSLFTKACKEGILDSPCNAALIASLRSQFPVYCSSLRGHGISPRGSDGCTSVQEVLVVYTTLPRALSIAALVLGLPHQPFFFFLPARKSSAKEQLHCHYMVQMYFCEALNKGRSWAGRKGKACQVCNRKHPTAALAVGNADAQQLVPLGVEMGSKEKIGPWARKRFSI